MPGSPRRRRRKRPRRTAHLRSRACCGSGEAPSGPRAAAGGAGRAGGAPRALPEPPRPLRGASPPWAGRAALRRPQRSFSPTAASAHLGSAFGTPAPPSCFPEPHGELPDTGVPTAGPGRSGGAAFPGPNPRRSAHTSPGSSRHAGTTMGRQIHLQALSNPVSILDFLLII